MRVKYSVDPYFLLVLLGTGEKLIFWVAILSNWLCMHPFLNEAMILQ